MVDDDDMIVVVFTDFSLVRTAMTNMDDDVSSDDGYAGMTRDQWKEYSRQIKASDVRQTKNVSPSVLSLFINVHWVLQGFDVDEFPPAYGIIRPVEVNHCIDLAIDHYEQKEVLRLIYKFVYFLVSYFSHSYIMC